MFPCGDEMVAIIDDREDVWSRCPNLIHVKPYVFFAGTADINAPPSRPSTTPGTSTSMATPSGAPFKVRHMMSSINNNMKAPVTMVTRHHQATNEPSPPPKQQDKENKSNTLEGDPPGISEQATSQSTPVEESGGENERTVHEEGESNGDHVALPAQSEPNHDPNVLIESGEAILDVPNDHAPGDISGNPEVDLVTKSNGNTNNNNGNGDDPSNQKEDDSSSSSGSSSSSEDEGEEAAVEGGQVGQGREEESRNERSSSSSSSSSGIDDNLFDSLDENIDELELDRVDSTKAKTTLAENTSTDTTKVEDACTVRGTDGTAKEPGIERSILFVEKDRDAGGQRVEEKSGTGLAADSANG